VKLDETRCKHVLRMMITGVNREFQCMLEPGHVFTHSFKSDTAEVVPFFTCNVCKREYMRVHDVVACDHGASERAAHAFLDRVEEGKKHDAGKPRMSLLPISAIMAILDVLEYGAKKYEVDNWRKVTDQRIRYYDAAQRHLMAWFQGEKRDDESGLRHLAHAVCCIVFLLAVEVEDD